ncbi:GNAT family N-acetyltransferase [Candidatus Gottesmanbacteria bacterium]|nr:GNAT family N-acetyltransferase [Candidatus Gottesmanbacteria bacterium]
MILRTSIQNAEEIWTTALANNDTRVPFATRPWHELWFKTLGTEWEPYLLSVDDTIVAPFARKNNEMIFSGGMEISDYLDIIGPNEKKQEAWQQILEYSKNDGITSFHFHNIPQSSPTVAFFQKLPNTAITREDTTPIIRFTGTWEEHIQSLQYKERHELRRKLRKIEKEHHGPTIISSADPAHDITILLELMQKDEQKQAFLTQDMTKFFQKIAEVFAHDISLLILYMNGQPAAATFSFTADHTYFLYNSGFNRECCPNAGFYLKAMSIKYALENGFKEYNFLQGDERYKYDLGGKDFFVYSISLAL